MKKTPTPAFSKKKKKPCARAPAAFSLFPPLPKNFRPNSKFHPPPAFHLPRSTREIQSNPPRSYQSNRSPRSSRFSEPDPSPTAANAGGPFSDQMGRPRKTKAEPEPAPAISIGKRSHFVI